jgi:hypothetical protein
MAQRRTLTEAQVDLLRWVAQGCPPGVYEDQFHRISAAALRRRGLIRTAGRGSHWRAHITDSGAEYLAQAEGPDPPAPRQANTSVTQQLVEEVIDAGGSLRVPMPRWGDPAAIDYERRARLAEVHDKVPAGKRLAVSVVSAEELEIELVDAPGHLPRDTPEQIEVPRKVGRYHPAARAFKEASERHEVSRGQVSRATRIVHVIAREGERRGWSVEVPPSSPNAYGRETWAASKDGHLRIEAGGGLFWLRLREDLVHTRGPWEEEVARYRNVDRDSTWYRDRELPSGRYDANAGGQLTIELYAAASWLFHGRRSRWGDRKRWQLEDRLADLLAEIEARVAEAERAAEEQRNAEEQARAVARQRAEERERQWRRHLERAGELRAESLRAKELRKQAERWREARALTEYCDAIEASHGKDAQTAEWLSWARTFIEDLDPTSAPPTGPKLEEPSAENLQPFMPEGWSAIGPDEREPQSNNRGRDPW